MHTMAIRRDPDLHEFAALTANDESAIAFARECHLLPQASTQPPPCKYPGCPGTLYDSTRKHKSGNTFPIVMCRKCKRYWSSGNGPDVLGGPAAGRNGGTFFSFKDDPTVTKWLASMLSSKREETLVHWRNFIRELLYRKLESAPPMGGPGQIVEIDESCFRGRRKNNKGRLMAGNNFPPARQNYGGLSNPIASNALPWGTTSVIAIAAGNTANFASPNFGALYPGGFARTTIFTCPFAMTMNCPTIQIQWSPFCLADYLKISGNGDRILCGATSLSAYSVPRGGTLRTEFRTDLINSDQGFSCTIACATA
ncbi:unnamed protein product [Darwinula stevensoni]|uniref:Uncharacterized protein n=1 Tax=Darwinula stevensoni TaxID=69355 RepID=A0A7R9A966_9CRUS|nr:unnamed protein product [Darwinula stevensoni]CAG0897119.1 unnamed protein product [Darwinula stevensoni]